MTAGSGPHIRGLKTTRQAARQWGLNHHTGIALAIFVLMFGSYVLLMQRANRTTSHEAPMHSVIGAVAPGPASSASAGPSRGQRTVEDRDTQRNTLSMSRPTPSKPAPSGQGHVAASVAQQSAVPAPVAQQPPAPAPNAHAAAHVALQPPAAAPVAQRNTVALAEPQPKAPAPTARSHVTAHDVAQPRFAESRPPARSAAAPAPDASRDNGVAGRDLAIARAALEENDLAQAHAALTRALDEDPANSEAFTLRQDLRSREQARDADLHTARACLARRQWTCAWHSAGNAQSIDSSSTEASALVERSFVNWGPDGPSPDSRP
jgi:hypothetical protein